MCNNDISSATCWRTPVCWSCANTRSIAATATTCSRACGRRRPTVLSKPGPESPTRGRQGGEVFAAGPSVLSKPGQESPIRGRKGGEVFAAGVVVKTQNPRVRRVPRPRVLIYVYAGGDARGIVEARQGGEAFAAGVKLRRVGPIVFATVPRLAQDKVESSAPAVATTYHRSPSIGGNTTRWVDCSLSAVCEIIPRGEVARDADVLCGSRGDIQFGTRRRNAAGGAWGLCSLACSSAGILEKSYNIIPPLSRGAAGVWVPLLLVGHQLVVIERNTASPTILVLIQKGGARG